MGVLLSIPIIGYFLVPSLGTYSASLNLLFFYLTWSTLILSQPPLKVEIIGTLAVRVLFFLIPSIIFFLFDALLPSLAVSVKLQGTSGLPVRTDRDGLKAIFRRQQWYRVIGLSLFNIGLSLAIQAGFELLLTDILRVRSALKLTSALPMPWSIVTDVIRGLISREITQYHIHRALHQPSHPNGISDLHTSYCHSIRAPYSFVAAYDHPLTYLLWRFVPLYLPSVIFRIHFLTYLVLLSIVSLEETLTTSGYNVVPGIVLGGFARRQDLHYQSQGRGNFAPWGFMDWLYGTSIGADVIEDMKEEVEKHQVAERSSEAWEKAKASGKEGIKALNARRKSIKNSRLQQSS